MVEAFMLAAGIVNALVSRRSSKARPSFQKQDAVAEHSSDSPVSAHSADRNFTNESLLVVARALDEGKLDEARDCLRALPFNPSFLPDGLIASALWKSLLTVQLSEDETRDDTLAAFERLATAAAQNEKMWDAYDALPILAKRIGETDTSAIVASVLWDCVLKSDSTLFVRTFDLLIKGGSDRCVFAMEQFLIAQKDFYPIYWDFVLLTRAVSARSLRDLSMLVEGLLQRTGRHDLGPLFEVYVLQMRQAPVLEIISAARSLPDPAQRSVVLQYVAHMSYTLEELRIVMAALPELVGHAIADQLIAIFMEARLAIAESRWHDAVRLAAMARSNRDYRHSAGLLFALASARLKRFDDAETALDDVRTHEAASPFQRARGVFISVTAALVKDGGLLPEERSLRLVPPAAGRPLVQSLWVGRKLRWIERLCIKSYLDHGWRFQLYVYDEPDNVPDGCEIMDASAIIPTKDVFFEGHRSAQHAGSVGAFSDLFRYQLLCKRGGLWTDTDVINRGTYDADGQRFVSTEITDAGIVTINGAIMAAPAGDAFVSEAYARARALLSSDAMFFTRIGPYLLGELILERGVRHVDLMPPAFLGPVAWMNVACLLQPFETVMKRPDFQKAINIHVYTEMWRTLGLGLERPAGKDTFLGRLYAEHFNE